MARSRRWRVVRLAFAVLAVLGPASLGAVEGETSVPRGDPAWLPYRALEGGPLRAARAALPKAVVVLRGSPILDAARDELVLGLGRMLSRSVELRQEGNTGGAIVLSTVSDLEAKFPSLAPPKLGEEAYWLKAIPATLGRTVVVAGGGERGVLYGAFALLRKVALEEDLSSLDETESPRAPLRYVDEWDNLDGTIERGYAGGSIFFDRGGVAADLSRVRDYARLLASVGVNGCAINNVNADPRILQAPLLGETARIASVLRPWGVRMLLAIDFSSPRSLGGLATFDPLDSEVARFWREKVDEVYRAVPDLGGFVLKADSEGRLGPAAYGRTHADAANVIASALSPHGGLLFYRGFVYDHHLDWRDKKADRARAAYDNFAKLDGLFLDNVVLQIKHGPIDFQVREPPSPLLGALERTNEAVELQITQEYTGQQRHLCFLPPMWKRVLDFDMGASKEPSPVKDLVAGRTFHRPFGGFVGVSNVGRDANWLHHPLALANLYGFGRLAWNPDLSARAIAQEWTTLTLSPDRAVVDTVVDLQLRSWPAYESYTGPLGAGTLTDILGPHYGPGIESSERNGWGQWHRADHDGIGMDRTTATGTGFIGQYRPRVASLFESLESCPDELLLFMHHVPYSHVLHSGKTVLEHIYDSHYSGAAEAQDFVLRWGSLRGRIPEGVFQDVLSRLIYQAAHAIVWRDAVCTWFLRTSGVPDAKGRAGHFPGRIEAEDMTLRGYEPFSVTPFETASGGRAVRCTSPDNHCSASFVFRGQPGRHDVAVSYFDLNNGSSRFRLFVGDELKDEWLADDSLPTSEPNGHSSTRRTIKSLALAPGEVISIHALADGAEQAPLDYVEISP